MFRNYKKKLWHILGNRKTFSMDESLRAGLYAEHKTRKMINEKIAGTGWKFYSSIRIPDKKNRRRREIDFIIVTNDDVVVIELKNWSGRLEVSDSNFIQYKKYNGETVNHGKVLNDLNDKCASLKFYFLEWTNINFEIKPLLVFYNNSIILPQELLNYKSVLNFEQFAEYLPNNSNSKSNIIEAILCFLRMEKAQSINENIISRGLPDALNALDHLGTWDIIELFGGKTIIGDILTDGDKSITTYGNCITDRCDISSINFQVDRNIFATLYRKPSSSINIFRRNGTVQKSKLNIKSILYFQEAGSRTISRVALRHVTRIEYGYSKKPSISSSWSNLKTGSIYEGKVKSIKKYGVFIDIGAPRLGLLHITAMNKGVRPGHFSIDDKINTRILYMSESKSIINLALI